MDDQGQQGRLILIVLLVLRQKPLLLSEFCTLDVSHVLARELLWRSRHCDRTQLAQKGL